MNKTGIEWAQWTWNPVTGCTPVSPGCRNCYAARMAKRLAGRAGYPADEPFRVTFHRDRLDEPLRRKPPSTIFVCSMSDLFHEAVPERVITGVFAVMEIAAHHRFLVLTKRPELVRRWGGTFPDNVGLGVTVETESQHWRIDTLLQCPAPMRFVSCEPLLGPLNLRKYIGGPEADLQGPKRDLEREPIRCVRCGEPWGWEENDTPHECPPGFGPALDWVIAGAETGPGARACHLSWAFDLRDQAVEAGVPFLWKRWGPGVPTRMLDGREWNQLPKWLGKDANGKSS